MALVTTVGGLIGGGAAASVVKDICMPLPQSAEFLALALK